MEQSNDATPQVALVFLSSALVMKLVSEVIHEVIGHGLFVVLFGGTISSIHISMLWPYELSSINWSVPELTIWQSVWLYAGGIFATGITALLVMAYLVRKRREWSIAVPFAWLAFWGLMNAAGYLVIGGLFPFGDVAVLMNLGALSGPAALFIGIAFLVGGFFVLSFTMRRCLKPVLGSHVPAANIVMWAVVPVVVLAASAGLGLFQPFILVAGMVPLGMSIVVEGHSMIRERNTTVS